MGRNIQDFYELNSLHQYAASDYGEWISNALEVEKVWKGEYGGKETVVDGDLTVPRPSQGRNIQSKLERMLAVRSDIKISCIPANDTKKEREKAEKRERALRAWLWQQRFETKRDVLRDGVFYALHRGRGPWQTRYEPGDDKLNVRLRAVDPLDCYPQFTDSGLDYFTTERWQTRITLEDYFNSMSVDELEQLNEIPNLRPLNENGEVESDDYTLYRVIEYWDDEYYAWAVDDTLVASGKHDYGFAPLAEARFNSTPLRDKRWASQGVLSPVAEDLKQLAILMAKATNAVEAFYYPLLVYKSESGRMVTVDSREVGVWEQVDPTFQPIILNPEPNDRLLDHLKGMFEQNVQQGTIPPIVFNTDLPNVSGFMVNQILSTIKDDLIDYQDGIEWAMSDALSQVLRIWEAKADEQEDGGFWLPMVGEDTGRKTMEMITADDIDGQYRVEVSLKVSLPQDLIQKSTIANQLWQVGPDGMRNLDWETTMEVSGLVDDVEDLQAAKRRREFEFLIMNDEDAKAAYIMKLKAQFMREFDQWEREIDRADAKQQKQDLRKTEREIEKGLSEDVVMPGEIAADQQKMIQYVQLLEEGMTPQGIIDALQAENPMIDTLTGGGMGQEFSPETMALVQQLTGGGPDGFTGYDNGISPQAAPAAMQGALPRQALDQPRLQVENMQDELSRGAAPPRR